MGIKTVLVTVEMIECQRCGHQWKPRDPANVRICPRCKSARFDELPKEKKERKEKEG